MTYQAFLKRLYLLLKNKWVLYAIQGKIFSFSSFEIVTNLKKLKLEFGTIIDAGANGGQFAKACSHFFPSTTIYSFEPLPDQFKHLLELKQKLPNANFYNLALGNESGVIHFNKNAYGHISSVLEINPDNEHYPHKKEELEKIEVTIEKLDNVIKKSDCLSPTLLKLDVQGYELPVLKGSTELLAESVDFILLEANLESLYKDQPSFTELNSFLNQNGFELYAMLDFNMGKQLKYIEIDVLYKKTT